MEKTLYLRGLGPISRQSELIELALTYKFDSIEVDMTDLVTRAAAMGKPFALQLFRSARVKVGTFQLTTDFGASDDDFSKEVTKLDLIVELAKDLGCNRCYVEVESGSDGQTFQENFENHRKRLNSVGTKLAEANIRLGVGLSPTAKQSKKTYKFVQTVDECLTLVRLVGNRNVVVSVDSFAWELGSGGIEQISNLTADRVSEIRLGDVPEGVDRASVSINQIATPGSTKSSLAIPLLKHLTKAGYKGGVGVVANPALQPGQSRDAMVGQFARRLQLLLDVAEGKREGLGESDAANLELAGATI